MRGSIRKREGRNGTSYQLIVELGLDPETGKRQQKCITFRGNKKEAEEKLREILRQIDTGAFVDPSKMTVAEYLDYWLEAYGPNLAPRTLDGYSRIISLHLKPALGKVLLQKLQPAHLQAYYAKALIEGRKDNKKAKGLSPTTVLQHHRLMREALKHAMQWQMVYRNVADAVQPPRRTKHEIQPPTGEQVQTVLEALRGTSLYMPAYIAAMTGLRMGEILGLGWDSIDLEARTVQIKRTLVRRADGELVFAPPKTPKSRRQLNLAPPLVRALKDHRKTLLEWRLAAGEAWQSLDLVCCLEDGSPINPGRLSNGFSRSAKKALGFAVRFHDLRHGAATLLLQAGVHPKVVADILGHSQISITLDTYSHVIPGLGRDAMQKLADALENGS